jgi:hypothetical protein
LLILTMILLVGICTALASWGARARPDPAEVALIPDDSTSNLNSISAETSAPRAEGDRNVQGLIGLGSEDSVSGRIPQPPVLPAAGQAPAAVPEPPALTLPVADTRLAERLYTTRDSHPGDNPMMRIWNWNMLGFKTVLAATLAASPTFADKSLDPPSDSDKLDGIQKQLDEIKKPLADLPKAVLALTKVERELKDLRAEYLAGVQQEQSQISELKKQVDLLKAEIESLRSRDVGATRIAGFPPTDSGLAATGRVEIRNTYPEAVGVRVNNKVYRVPPSETVLSDPVPAGTFTYEVFYVTPPRSRTVAAGKTFLVHVHPQP